MVRFGEDGMAGSDEWVLASEKDCGRYAPGGMVASPWLKVTVPEPTVCAAIETTEAN
jgi:hypothetical protein